MKISGPDQTEYEDEHTDAQNQHTERFTELCQLLLERSLVFFGPGKCVCYFSHLRIHAGGRHNSRSSSVDYRASHIDHVFSVAQRNLFCLIIPGPCAAARSFALFFGRNRLAGQSRFLNLQGCALQYASVGRHRITGLQKYHISHHQLFTLDALHLSVPVHLGNGRRHLLQRFYGFFCLTLLIHSQYGIYHHHSQDNYHIRK